MDKELVARQKDFNKEYIKVLSGAEMNKPMLDLMETLSKTVALLIDKQLENEQHIQDLKQEIELLKGKIDVLQV